MTSFLNGPAAGVTLMLRRAPHYLRVVQKADGTWDALDQLTDTPDADERVYAYITERGPFRVHVCSRGKGRNSSGWYERAEYRLIPEQPSDEQLRSTTRWRAWVMAAIGKPLAEDGTLAEDQP